MWLSVSVKEKSGIDTFLTSCFLANIPNEEAYVLFVNGLSCSREVIQLDDYYVRTKCMKDMRDSWLSKC